MRLSKRSKMPPCPGKALPLSLMPTSRLMAEMLKSPKNPPTLMIKPAAKASMCVKGVKYGANSIINVVVLKTPPKKPSHVLFGLIDGVIL